jgi:hypothetical protein
MQLNANSRIAAGQRLLSSFFEIKQLSRLNLQKITLVMNNSSV